MMSTEDNISVGESVKMKGRWIAEEQRRRAADKLKLLKEEEMMISKMKAKLERRRKKEERKEKDKERMERGNRELEMNKSLFSGEESFFEVQPVNSSTQKTVLFNEKLTNVRNISPVEIVEDERIVADLNRGDHLVVDTGSENQIVVKNILPLSQQVFPATPPHKRIRRKVKKSLSLESGNAKHLPKFSPNVIKGFDVKEGVERLLFSNQLNSCEYFLPKEYTSLKLEKIRENKILNSSFTSYSPSLLDSSGKRKREMLADEIHRESVSSPKRRVKSCYKELARSNKCVISRKSEIPAVENVLYEKCSAGQFSVVVCISAGSLQVWTSRLGIGGIWVRLGEFSCEKKLLYPFLVLDLDSIRIKAFSVENNQVKETSFVILGENGDFSDSVTATQNVLVLTETIHIDSLIVEKYDDKQVIVFHNLNKFTRGSIVTYNHDQLEVTFLTTLECSTLAVKKCNGIENIFLCFMNNFLHFWNIRSGKCVKTIDIDLARIDCLSILKVFDVMGNINILQFNDDMLSFSVLRQSGFQVVASIPSKKPARALEYSTYGLFPSNGESLAFLLGNVWISWSISEKVLKSKKISNPQDLSDILGL